MISAPHAFIHTTFQLYSCQQTAVISQCVAKCFCSDLAVAQIQKRASINIIAAYLSTILPMSDRSNDADDGIKFSETIRFLGTADLARGGSETLSDKPLLGP